MNGAAFTFPRKFSLLHPLSDLYLASYELQVGYFARRCYLHKCFSCVSLFVYITLFAGSI